MTRPLAPEDLRAALPDTTGVVRLPGLGATVDVWREPEGVPHVLAGSAPDAFLGQWFVRA